MEVSKYEKIKIKKQNKKETKINKNKIGQWSKEEHEIFIQSLILYGNSWKKVINNIIYIFKLIFINIQISQFLPFRTQRQVYSHSRKFFKILQKNFTYEESLKFKNFFLTKEAENIVKQIIKEKKSFLDFDYIIIQKLIMSIFGIKGTKRIEKNNKDSNHLIKNNTTFNSLTSKIQTKLYLMRNLNLFEQNEKNELSIIIFKNTPKEILYSMFNIE